MLISYKHALLGSYLWKEKSGAVDLQRGGGKVGRTQSSRGRGGCAHDLVQWRRINKNKKQRKSFPLSALWRFTYLTKLAKSQMRNHPMEECEPNKINHLLPIFTVSSKTYKAIILTFCNQRSCLNL